MEELEVSVCLRKYAGVHPPNLKEGESVSGPLVSRFCTLLPFQHNNLEGPLPPSIEWTELTELLINDNALSGQLPSSIGNMTSLVNFLVVCAPAKVLQSLPSSFKYASDILLPLSLEIHT